MLPAQNFEKHLKTGDKAPRITGIDQNGVKVDSDILLKKKRILLVFYRGNWCPYCRKHLKSLEDNLKALAEKGYAVIVVTPEKVEQTQETTRRLNLDFSILHDKDNRIMEDFGVSFEVNEQTVPNYYKLVRKKVATNNGADNMVLPVPATYIIGKDGIISYVQFDPDYKNRSDFKEILKM